MESESGIAASEQSIDTIKFNLVDERLLLLIILIPCVRAYFTCLRCIAPDRYQTPPYRGFDSWLGYFHAEENYFTQMFGGSGSPVNAGCGNATCCGIDFTQGDEAKEIGPSKLNGDYSTYVYIKRAQDIISSHPKSLPLYMYLPFQNAHGPTESPQRFHDMYANLSLPAYRNQIQACITALDEGVGNLTNSLRVAGLWENTIIVFQSDNGGDTGGQGAGMNNYPLRGTKWTHWEGGTRVVAFISGPLIPTSRRGSKYSGMVHSTDWRPTFASLAQIEPDNSGPYPLDGHDVWDAIMSDGPSPRNEVVHQVLYKNIVNQSCSPLNIILKSGHLTHCGAAIRIGQWKLMLGYPGWPDKVFPLPTGPNPNVTEPRLNSSTDYSKLPCSEGCLFDVESDPSETHDVYAQNPSIVAKLKARLDVLSKEGLPALNPPTYVVPPTPAEDADNKKKCAKVEQTGYWLSWQDEDHGF